MTPEKSTPEATKGPSSAGDSDSWVMKSLNDLRDDMKTMDDRSASSFGSISSQLTGVDRRLGEIEGRISKLIWLVMGAGLVLGLMFGGFELLTTYFDIQITPKQ